MPCLILFCLLDYDDKLGDNGQYINLKSVEFIKTDPGTACSKSFEKLTHGFKVNTALTIEDIAVASNTFCQLLDCLSLASSDWPNRGSTILEM